ncbi:MAG: N-acetylmuramic acid 6-phosphate etherase [Geminicoccaceae bacterium]
MDTEARIETDGGWDRWPLDRALATMLDYQRRALSAVEQALPSIARAVEESARRLHGTAGRLILTGAGASGRIAVQDGVELFPTFGWPHDRLLYRMAGGDGALVRSVEGAEDDAGAGRREVEALAPGHDDVHIAVAASGTTRYTVEAQRTARERGALTIALACNPGSPLLDGAAIPVLLETGPEFLAGSTRMSAGTAQKVALNLFSTQLMTRLGRVYDGYMVHVVASNAKLRERAVRIVCSITGATLDAARAAMDAAGFDIPVAVLMIDGAGLEEARRRMAEAEGDLRRARDPGS